MKQEGFLSQGLQLAADNSRWVGNQAFFNKPDNDPLDDDLRGVIGTAILGYARAYTFDVEVESGFAARCRSAQSIGEAKALMADVEDVVAALKAAA